MQAASHQAKKTLRLMRLKRTKILTNEEPACTSGFYLLNKIVGLLPASVRFLKRRGKIHGDSSRIRNGSLPRLSHCLLRPLLGHASEHVILVLFISSGRLTLSFRCSARARCRLSPSSLQLLLLLPIVFIFLWGYRRESPLSQNDTRLCDPTWLFRICKHLPSF